MIFSRSVMLGAVLLLGAAGFPDAGEVARHGPGDRALPVQQEQSDLQCVDAFQWRFQPGVGPTVERQKITGTLHVGTELSPATPCTSGTGVPYLGAVGKFEGQGEFGCTTTSLTGEAQGTIDVIWDNGDRSVAEWTMVSYAMTPIVQATFVEGPLTGALIVQESWPTGVNGNCASQPLTGAGYTGVVEIIKAE